MVAYANFVRKRSASPRSPGAKAPGARLPAAERRARILASATPVFARRGFEGTTTRDLARAAGVSEPILYRHFPSKEALFDAVFDAAEARILRELEEAGGGAEGPSRLDAIAQALDGILARRADDFRLVNGCASSHVGAETAKRVRRTYTRIGALLTDVAAEAGLARGVSPVVAGHLLLEVGLGASLVRPVGVAAIADQAYLPAVMRILTAGLRGT
jgi:AcrR family transcriptional regulator